MLSTAPGFAAATFTPPAPSVAQGAAFTETLSDTIDVADTIGAVDLSITYDPAVLSFVTAADGALLPDWLILSNISSPGLALISASEPATALSDANGTGSVVTLDFDALAAAPTGPSLVTLATTAAAAGVDGEYQLPSSSFTVSVTSSGTVSMPAPGAAALVLPFAAWLLARRRRSI